MWNDSIVEEVRKHRREIELECNGDFSLLFSKAKALENSLKNNLRKKVIRKKMTSKIKEER